MTNKYTCEGRDIPSRRVNSLILDGWSLVNVTTDESIGNEWLLVKADDDTHKLDEDK
tara:strand:- start:26 stop:196 length:171 start_codon:yes stop_codon:yes gene_type:complete